MMGSLPDEMFKWKIPSVFILGIFITSFQNISHIRAATVNYNILLDYPFRVNLTSVTNLLISRLSNLALLDMSNCLRLYTFNFTQLPVLDVYTSMSTLLQVSKQIKDNRTILFAGYGTYFGKRMSGMNASADSIYQRSGAYLENVPRLYSYWFDDSLYINIVHQMLLSIQQNSSKPLEEKVALVIYNNQYKSVYPFNQRLQLNPLTKGLLGSITVFYYTNATSAEIIASSIAELSIVTTIVTMLNGADTNAILTAGLAHSLIRWSVRWIVCLQEGSIDFKNGLFYDVDSRNVTVLTAGLPSNTTKFPINVLGPNQTALNTTEDAYIYDLITAVMYSLSYAVCKDVTSLPVNMSGLTGETAFVKFNVTKGESWSTKRISHIVRAYRGLGSVMRYDSDIQLNDSYELMSPVPRPQNRTVVWKRLKPVKILFYKNEPDNKLKTNVDPRSNFNDKVEGYMVELLKVLLERANMTYQFEQADPSIETGSKDPVSGTWNGILGAVKNGTYDMSSSFLTWTSGRAEDFDVVRGIMYYSMSLLVSNVEPSAFSTFFQFLDPLHLYVWLAVLGTTFFFAIILAILHRMSPNTRDFSLYESFFFTLGSLLHGVTVDAPNRYSSRLVTCAFWSFSFVIFSLYVANYGAILTKERLKPTISNVADLLQSAQDYNFGTFKPSFLFDYLWSSNNLDEKVLAKIMAYDLNNATLDYTDDVIEKMKLGDYIFIDESPNNNYRAYEHCYNSTGYFGSFEYVLYLSKHNDLTSILQQHLDNLNTDNVNDDLQNKYWPMTPNPKCVPNDFLTKLTVFTKQLDSQVIDVLEALRVDYMGGIFIILLAGCFVCVAIALIEWGFRNTLQRLLVNFSRKQNSQNRGDYLNF